MEFFSKASVMQQSLFMLLVFTGIFPLLRSLPRKYYLIEQEKTWSEARAYCQANYTDLATIENVDDMLQLQSVAQSKQFSSKAWFGLINAIDSWYWSFENKPLGPLSSWDSNQPDNHNGKEECALINKGIWLDMPCVQRNPFICFDDTKYGIEQYIYVFDKMTWHAAQSYCRQRYTDLASVRDKEETITILSTLPGGNFWFGLFRDSWKWTDQTNVSSIKWKHGQPDNKNHNENCGYLLNGQAEDDVCSVKIFFFCHSVITGQKQIIRVKVRSETDEITEVKAAILEKLKDKLKEHGVNGSVMWRKQPDGEVFNKEKEKK